MKIGAVSIHEFLDLYSNARIEGERLTEYLKGLDLNTYQNHIRALIQGLREGTTEIAEVQEVLSQTQLTFARRLSEVIDLFRQGAVTLKRVEEIVRQVQKAFPESDLSDLAEALYNALKK